MATSNPRITITLTPAVHAALKRLSELNGKSQSAIVSEMLEESLPTFEKMVRVLAIAKEASGKAKEDFRSGLEAAQANLEKQLGLLVDVVDEGEATLLGDVERIRRRAPRGAASAADLGAQPAQTPMSNRGVTPHPRGQKVGKTITSRKGQ